MQGLSQFVHVGTAHIRACAPGSNAASAQLPWERDRAAAPWPVPRALELKLSKDASWRPGGLERTEVLLVVCIVCLQQGVQVGCRRRTVLAALLRIWPTPSPNPLTRVLRGRPGEF